MDLEITKSDGTSFLLSDHDIFIDDFIVGSIQIESNYGTVEGRAGRVDYGATHGIRTIKAPFHLKAHDLLDFPLVRDALYGLVLDTESFFIRELRRPKLLQYDFVDFTESAVDENGKRKYSEDSQNEYVGGKRYLVRLSNTFDIEQTLEFGEGELIFETTEFPYAESVGSTVDIETNGLASFDEVWSFGMGLIDDPASHQYMHTGTSYSVYNAGNVTVDPFEHELVLAIDNVIGSTDFLELKNTTNGTAFRVNEAVSDSQQVLLDGPNVTSNGLQFLRKTSKEFIVMSPGWNHFVLSGVTSARVKNNFRFYYL